MQTFARRYETAAPAATRARAASHGFGLMANGSWPMTCTVVPTIDHKQPPRRPTVIPT